MHTNEDKETCEEEPNPDAGYYWDNLKTVYSFDNCFVLLSTHHLFFYSSLLLLHFQDLVSHCESGRVPSVWNMNYYCWEGSKSTFQTWIHSFNSIIKRNRHSRWILLCTKLENMCVHKYLIDMTTKNIKTITGSA